MMLAIGEAFGEASRAFSRASTAVSTINLKCFKAFQYTVNFSTSIPEKYGCAVPVLISLGAFSIVIDPFL